MFLETQKHLFQCMHMYIHAGSVSMHAYVHSRSICSNGCICTLMQYLFQCMHRYIHAVSVPVHAYVHSWSICSSACIAYVHSCGNYFNIVMYTHCICTLSICPLHSHMHIHTCIYTTVFCPLPCRKPCKHALNTTVSSYGIYYLVLRKEHINIGHKTCGKYKQSVLLYELLSKSYSSVVIVHKMFLKSPTDRLG